MPDKRFSIAGEWMCRLDPDDKGLGEGWEKAGFKGSSCKLPGTVGENGLGEELRVTLEMNKENVKSLRQRFRYVGAAWYRTTFDIPAEWQGGRIELFLERVMFESRVWIDGNEVGRADSLSVPHLYEIGPFVRAGGKHELTVRIDNRDIQRIGTYPSAFTDETQTIWNGILGRMEIRRQAPVSLDEIQVYPDPDTKAARVRAVVKLAGEEAASRLKLTVQGISENTGVRHATACQAVERSVVHGACAELDFTFSFGEDALLWDEFSPAVYELSFTLEADCGSTVYCSEKKVSCGLRRFGTDQTRFTINGRPVFLRGTLDCCIYPLTGYPPMDEPFWERMFHTVKEYGLNHVRFHSWCPPEAAFQAADRSGVYLQVEGPIWLDTWNTPIGQYPEHYTYLPEETARILDRYANHPSFCLFSNGNEIRGDFKLLHEMTANLKKRDPRVLYTLTSNWDRPLDPADDFFVAQTVDGVGVRGQYFHDRMAEATDLDFGEAVALRDVPIITHEVGQYSVYPNIAEIDKYTGLLRPVNYETIRHDLANRGMLEMAPSFVEGSGQLALQLYRDEIEATLRTQGLGGFQLLDLHDFPGQSTATVGILDAFWESKGLIEPAEFRKFCGPSVLLLRMPKRIYRNDEAFTAKLEIAHFGPLPLTGVSVSWEVVSESGETVAHGTAGVFDIPVGNGFPLGEISDLPLNAVKQAACLQVKVRAEGTGIENSWDIWVYPQQEVKPIGPAAGSIRIADRLNKETESWLAGGKSVLLLPRAEEVSAKLQGRFFPVFWSPVHFSSPDPCGIYCDSEHPVFTKFPTRYYAGYQWKDLLEHSFAIDYSRHAAAFQPIVQVIPNFYHNRCWTNLFEARIGKGKLLVCTLDISGSLETRHAARQLRASILEYMNGEAFQPKMEMSREALEHLLSPPAVSEAAAALGGESDVALLKPAEADTDDGKEHAAGCGNDGMEHTYWQAADEHIGHWWQVDLGKKADITGTRVVFAEPGNYHYVIRTSDDGINWIVSSNRTGHTESRPEETDRFSARARFVRIIYNTLPQGIKAGHRMFQVFGTFEDK